MPFRVRLPVLAGAEYWVVGLRDTGLLWLIWESGSRMIAYCWVCATFIAAGALLLQ